MKRCTHSPFTRGRFSTPAVAWCFAGLLLFSAMVAGCKPGEKTGKTKTDSEDAKTASAKTDSVKTTKMKTTVTKKTTPPKKTKTTPKVAKKDPPKKKEEVKLTPKQKALADAILELGQIGAVFDYNNLEEVVKVTFAEKERVQDRHFALLKHFPYLRYIDATRTKIGDAAIKHLEGSEFITDLYLYGTEVSDKGLETIGGMRRLERLCVDQTRITDAGLKHLENLPVISKLHIRSKNKISDAGLSPIYKLKSLRELKIGGTEITSKGRDKLKTFLPNCKIDTEPVSK